MNIPIGRAKKIILYTMGISLVLVGSLGFLVIDEKFALKQILILILVNIIIMHVSGLFFRVGKTKA
jgi:MFS-type transporter involved in bile tolerance (Atg22 family)